LAKDDIAQLIMSCAKEILSISSISRCCALSVLGSRVWPFKVTWRHRSRNHSIAHIPFPIGGPLEASSYR